MLTVEPLDPDSPIPYSITPLGKAELVVERLRSWRDQDYARANLKAFREVCELNFDRETVEAIFE